MTDSSIVEMLAQGSPASSGKGSPLEALGIVGAAIGAVLVLTVVVLLVRRKFLAPASTTDISSAGFMEQLRILRDRGQISDAEFDHARSRLGRKIREEQLQSPPQGAKPQTGAKIAASRSPGSTTRSNVQKPPQSSHGS